MTETAARECVGLPAGPPRPVLRITLFSRMRAEASDGRSVLPPGRKTRAVLALLAVNAPRPVLRTQITTLLWGRRDPPQARASLRQAVHELQSALGSSARLLEADRNYLALRADGLWVDVAAVLQATPGNPQRLKCFRPSLLEDLAGVDPEFDRWAAREHEQIARQARAVAEAALLAAQTPAAAIEAAEMLLAIDGAHEGAWRALIEANASLGDRAGAMAAHQRCKSSLAALARLDPSPEIEALAAKIRLGQQDRAIVPTEVLPPPAPPTVRYWKPLRTRVGVTHFRGIPGPAEAAFAAGLSEELVTALAFFRSLSCVPYGLLAGLAGASAGAAAGADWLDLDFLLDGSVQGDRERVRVAVRLLDVGGGGDVIWTRRFDRELTAVLDLQDEISAAVAAQVEAKLLVRDSTRDRSRAAAEVAALLRQAVPALHRMDRGTFLAAGEMLEQALQLDPLSAATCNWLSHWHVFAAGQGWARSRREASARSRELAEQAIALDPEDARALAMAGHVRGFIDRRPDEAEALHARATQANPNLPLAWCLSGLTETYLGRHKESIRRIGRAIALSPEDPLTFFFQASLAIPHFLDGDYTAAALIGRRAIALNPSLSSAYKTQLAALGHLGWTEEAAAIRAGLLTLEPQFSLGEALDRSSITDPESRTRYAEGLRLAGLS